MLKRPKGPIPAKCPRLGGGGRGFTLTGALYWSAAQIKGPIPAKCPRLGGGGRGFTLTGALYWSAAQIICKANIIDCQAQAHHFL